MYDEERILKVASMDGLYDEKGTSEKGYDWAGSALNRPICWLLGHQWKSGYSSRKEHFPDGRMKASYARWCDRCGLIDCEHVFDTKTIYEVEVRKYYSISYTIRHCALCNRRIYTNGWGIESSSPEARKLMIEVQKELNVSMVFGQELTTATSIILDSEGIEAARSFLRQAYLSERIPARGMHLVGY
mgnify:FL=1